MGDGEAKESEEERDGARMEGKERERKRGGGKL